MRNPLTHKDYTTKAIREYPRIVFILYWLPVSIVQAEFRAYNDFTIIRK